MGKALKAIGITLMIVAIAQLVFQIVVMSVPIYNGRGAGSRNINIAMPGFYTLEASHCFEYIYEEIPTGTLSLRNIATGATYQFDYEMHSHTSNVETEFDARSYFLVAGDYVLTVVIVTGTVIAEVRMTGWYNVDVTTGRDSEGWGALISILIAIAFFAIGNKVRRLGNE